MQAGKKARVAKLIGTGNSGDSIITLMEDLDGAGFAVRHSEADISVATTCVKWIGHFHATFFAKDLRQVWPVGTYWFLDTRPDEWHKMPPSELKETAKQIDQKLNNAAFQTLLHGDAKIANFCFSADSKRVAAVDFQYTGSGCGVKDLIYFLGSCFSSSELEHYADRLIDIYFNTLIKALGNKLCGSEKVTLQKEWKSLIPFVWADFNRFLLGWAPTHHKLTNYSQRQTKLALNML